MALTVPTKAFQESSPDTLRYIKDWCEVAGKLTSTVCLWVICVASRCVSCSQHLVVVVSENAGTALVWNSTADVKDSVMVVQVWNQWLLRQCK